MSVSPDRATAERFAVSAALRYPDLAEEAGMTPRDFLDERLGQAWEAVARVSFRTEDGRMPLADLAAESGVSVEHLIDACRCQVYAPDQARHWWSRLRDLATAARLRFDLLAMAHKERKGEDVSGELLSELEQLQHRYSEQEVDQGVKTLSEIAAQYVSERSAELRIGRRLGIVTGFASVDDWMGGLNPGELTVLVAAGGAGKSTMALDMARRCAAKGTSVLVFSAEMTARQLGQREIHAALGRSITYRDVGAVDLQDGLQRVTEAEFSRRIYVDDRTRVSASQVLATARRLQSSQGLGLLVFDHLGHWDSQKPRGTEQEQLAASIVQAKDLAKILDVAVLMLCHFNRARRDAERPSMELIRGTGKIDDVADNIVAIWRKDGEETSELHMLKCRQTGQVRRVMELEYSSRSQSYTELGEVHRAATTTQATPRRAGASSAPPF